MDDDTDDPTAMHYPKEGEFGYPHSPWSAFLVTSIHAETYALWEALREAGIDVQASNGTDTSDGLPDEKFPHMLVSAQGLQALLDAYLGPKRHEEYLKEVERVGGLPKFHRDVVMGLLEVKRNHPDLADCFRGEANFLQECSRTTHLNPAQENQLMDLRMFVVDAWIESVGVKRRRQRKDGSFYEMLELKDDMPDWMTAFS